eukprot:211822-Chlamydomonas_euryale.AAC.2
MHVILGGNARAGFAVFEGGKHAAHCSHRRRRVGGGGLQMRRRPPPPPSPRASGEAQTPFPPPRASGEAQTPSPSFPLSFR